MSDALPVAAQPPVFDPDHEYCEEYRRVILSDADFVRAVELHRKRAFDKSMRELKQSAHFSPEPADSRSPRRRAVPESPFSDAPLSKRMRHEVPLVIEFDPSCALTPAYVGSCTPRGHGPRSPFN
jgi:hypothetical protein